MTPETLIIRHCAPTLAGLKSSSLVCLKFACGDLAGTLARLASKGVGFRFFCNAHGCPLLFVYRPWALKQVLKDQRVKRHLSQLGYETEDLTHCLRTLGRRLERSSFPHEIGFFLGYPVASSWAIRWRTCCPSSRRVVGVSDTAECGRCTTT